MKRQFAVLSSLLVLMAVTGCGNSGSSSGSNGTSSTGGTGTSGGSAIAISLQCPPQIQAGVSSPSTYVCTAAVTGTSDTSYSLALTGSGDTTRATLDAGTGVLTPSADTTGTVTVTATADADKTRTATATVKVVDWILAYLPSGSADSVGIINADGSSTQVLLNDIEGDQCEDLAWRPDHLEFLCTEGGNGWDGGIIDIYSTDGTASGTKKVVSINLLGSGQTCGNDTGCDAIQPTFSPDGKTILYVAPGAPVNNVAVMAIWTVQADGTQPPVRIYSPPASTYFEAPAHFSPDGSHVTFWNASDQSVWIVNADGTNAHQLIAGQSHLPAIFSPDGSSVYYDGTNGVYVANSDGSNPRQIASTGSIIGLSPNGKSILFQQKQSDGNGGTLVELYTADAGTGANTQEIYHADYGGNIPWGVGSWWF